MTTPPPHTPPPHAFVISLPDSPRRETVAKNLARVGITNPIFFDAVNGRELTPQQQKPFHESGRQYWSNRVWGVGSMGCTLSHLSIFQKMIDENIPYALIFEDDAEPITPNPEFIAERLNYLVSIQDQLDIVFLNNARNRPVIPIDGLDGLGVIPQTSITNESYFITQGAAAYFLTHPLRFTIAIDIVMHQWWLNDGTINILYHTPTLFRQNDSPSEIATTPQKPNRYRRGLGVAAVMRARKLKHSIIKRLLGAAYARKVRRRFKGVSAR